jgi:hypothetical protein
VTEWERVRMRCEHMRNSAPSHMLIMPSEACTKRTGRESEDAKGAEKIRET